MEHVIVRRGFGVFFDGEWLGTMFAPTVGQCVLKLCCEVCLEMHREWPPPSGAEAIHGHIPALLFSNPIPIERGGKDYYVARLPNLGEVSYNFDAEHLVPPPLYFKERPAVDLSPASS